MQRYTIDEELIDLMSDDGKFVLWNDMKIARDDDLLRFEFLEGFLELFKEEADKEESKWCERMRSKSKCIAELEAKLELTEKALNRCDCMEEGVGTDPICARCGYQLYDQKRIDELQDAVRKLLELRLNDHDDACQYERRLESDHILISPCSALCTVNLTQDKARKIAYAVLTRDEEEATP